MTFYEHNIKAVVNMEAFKIQETIEGKKTHEYGKSSILIYRFTDSHNETAIKCSIWLISYNLKNKRKKYGKRQTQSLHRLIFDLHYLIENIVCNFSHKTYNSYHLNAPIITLKKNHVK